MPATPVDSAITSGLFGSDPMRAVFSDRSRLQHMLDIEAALARVEARLGLIPQAAADAITQAAKVDRLDVPALAASTASVGYPVVALARQLGQAAGPDAARFVHWGATTQDILDTATMLQVREGLGLVEQDLRRVIAGLAALARRHRDLPMAGRTHLQHALPITFGYKVAVWLQPLLRLLESTRRLRQGLVVEFAGAVGTSAALGDRGGEVLAELARELDLGTTAAPWHVDRLRLAEVVCHLGLLGGALAKIATDVILLMQTEVAEVSEPHQAGRGGSSTMPQKRNPIASEYILAAVRGVQAMAPLMLGAMAHDHERGTGPWQSEDIALPQAFLLIAGALGHAASLAEGLVVDGERMRSNIAASGGLIMSEAVMMHLAPKIGREAAHHAVQQACDRVLAGEGSLLDVLERHPDLQGQVVRADIDRCLDPSAYLGRAGEIVDTVLAQARECLGDGRF